jgi:outer membrane protein
MARLNFENKKNTLFKEIQQASADATAALKKYQATTKSLSALQESYRYTEQKFGLGMVTTLDYTTAKTRLAKSETDLLQAKYEFIFKTKILDFYKGNPIKL